MASKQGKHVSANELAEILGVNRHTVVEWSKKGCPSVEKADKESGRPWIFDVAQVMAWRESQAAGAAAEMFGDPISKDEAQRRRAIAQAAMAELDLAERKKELVQISDVTGAVSAEYALVRTALMNLPAKVSGRIALIDDPAVIQSEIEGAITEALKNLKADTNGKYGPISVS
jgi:phage terminase Nu1 subunit (DNA packaging protein)